jgi:hypothetical protein
MYCLCVSCSGVIYCVCALFVCNLCYLSVVLLYYCHRVKSQLQLIKKIRTEVIQFKGLRHTVWVIPAAVAIGEDGCMRTRWVATLSRILPSHRPTYLRILSCISCT